MDHIATIATAVAGSQLTERAEEIIAGGFSAHGCAAKKFIQGNAQYLSCQPQAEQGYWVYHAGCQHAHWQQQRNGSRLPDSMPQPLDGGHAPGSQRSHAHQQQQRGELRAGGAFIEWRPHSHFLSGG